MLRLAYAQPDPALLVSARFMLGMILFSRGKAASAHTHHTQVLVIYSPHKHRAPALSYGLDLGVGSHLHLALELWQLGDPNQAMQHRQTARTLAQ
jgi:hypothetical protein